MFFIFCMLHAIISFIYLLYYKLNVSHIYLKNVYLGGSRGCKKEILGGNFKI